MISTSHCAAKSVVVPGRARHVCYCHSPMRYAWDQFDAYFGPEQVGGAGRAAAAGHGPAGALGRAPRRAAWTALSRILNMLRGESADTIIARRPSCIPLSIRTSISPTPADVPTISWSSRPWCPTSGSTSPFAPARQAGVRLKIVGTGPRGSSLARGGRPGRVEFLGWLSDDEIRELYQRQPGGAHARRGGLRHGAGGGAGLRPPGGCARGGRSARKRGRRRDRSARRAKTPSRPLPRPLRAVASRRFDAAAIRRHAEQFSTDRFKRQFAAVVTAAVASPLQEDAE